MADFCVDCWNKLNEENKSEKSYVLSRDLDLCEGCGEYKRVIMGDRETYYFYKFRRLLFPIRFVYRLIYFLWRLMLLPFLIYKYNKSKKK